MRCERQGDLFSRIYCGVVRKCRRHFQSTSPKANNSMQVTGTVMTVALRRAALTLRRKKMLLKVDRSIRIKLVVRRMARVQRAHCLRKTDCFVS